MNSNHRSSDTPIKNQPRNVWRRRRLVLIHSRAEEQHMQIIHHSTPENKPYLIDDTSPELSLAASLIQHRHSVSPSLARLIVRENFGGEA